jgi:ketosteroid isomerase-like protein
MSEEDVERTRKAFGAYVRGDFDEVLAILDPDIVYKSAQEAPVQGREAVRAAWERWEASWEEVEMTSEDHRRR